MKYFIFALGGVVITELASFEEAKSFETINFQLPDTGEEKGVFFASFDSGIIFAETDTEAALLLRQKMI